MNTAFLLMAQYNGAAVIPVEAVCRDFFSHLTPGKFIQKVSTGEIAIPMVRIEGSQKSAKGRPSSAPMCRLIAFAIFSTRRQEEICRIARADLDEQHSRVMVRDMKNPGEKEGNDVWCDLPEPAMRIIKAQPRGTAKEIFPYSAGGISAAFTRACALLGIEDLHFHDLRHEGISWLFETGYNIPHAAAVSGHRSWTSLKRYTQLRQRGDKYAGWTWLDRVTTA